MNGVDGDSIEWWPNEFCRRDLIWCTDAKLHYLYDTIQPSSCNGVCLYDILYSISSMVLVYYLQKYHGSTDSIYLIILENINFSIYELAKDIIGTLFSFSTFDIK